MDDCLFCRIAARKLPAKVIYEDAILLAFHDIQPAAEVHVLLIPKLHITSLLDLQLEHEMLMGKFMCFVPTLAKLLKLEKGFRFIFNTGVLGGQEIGHMHAHFIGNYDRKLLAMIGS